MGCQEMKSELWPRFAKLAASVALMAGITNFACNSSEPSFRGTALDSPIPVADFTLTDQRNRPFRLSDHRGEIILLFFGYAYCPDVCPYTLSTWKQVQNALQDTSDRLKFVFVTVDPARDTVEQLRKHLSVYSPNFYGLTDTPEKLQPVYDAFGVYREKVSISNRATGYLMNHTSRIFLIEATGEWRLSYPFDAKAEDIVHDVRQLLARGLHGPQIRAENGWSWPVAISAETEIPTESIDDTSLSSGHNRPAKRNMGSNGVVYVTLVNDGNKSDRLIAVHSEISEFAEIHETKIIDDRMMMRPVEGGLEIPANGQLELKPAGAHIMLIGLRQPLRGGDRFEVLLEFEKSGSKRLVSEVVQRAVKKN